MTESAAKKEAPKTRTREAIEAELTALERQFEILEKTGDTLNKRINNLPNDQAEKLAKELNEHDIPDDELRAMFPSPSTLSVAIDFRDFINKYKILLEKRRSLEEELTPYRKQDLEKMLRDILVRINYDKIFEYYETNKKNNIYNTARQLYELRRLQYRLLNPTEESLNFDFYDYWCHTLFSFSEE